MNWKKAVPKAFKLHQHLPMLRSRDLIGNVNAPRKTVHTIKAKKAGEVQVIGTPWDATADCKPVQFTVLVSKGGIVPDDTDYTALVKEDIQHGMDYLQKEPVNAYGDEWNIFTTLRAGGTISQENLDAYYASVSEKLQILTVSI